MKCAVMVAVGFAMGASTLVAGCAAGGARSGAAGQSSVGHAECPVCKYEGDLACVDVAVDESTPRADIGGRTYYFCSEACRSKCRKQPARYVRQ